MTSKLVAKIESEEPTLRLAVLIDADNAQASIIEGLLTEIANFGEATVKRIYGDFTSPTSSQWRKVLQRYAIKPMHQFAYTTGKNATDSTLIIDAMDLLDTGRFDGFCLVSSDSDFTGLAVRLREAGLTVLGFGEKKTPEAFRNACHKFVFTEVLRPPVDVEKAAVTVESRPEPTRGAPPPKADDAGVPAIPIAAALPADFIADALASAKGDDGGWINFGTFGSYLTKLRSDFDPRVYGFKKLSELVRALPNTCEIEERATPDSSTKVIYIRRRSR
jgi:hypothetical protein